MLFLFYINIIASVIKTCQNWPKLLINRILTRIGLSFFAPKINQIKLKDGTKFSMGSSKTIGGADLFLISEIWDRQSYYTSSHPKFKINKGDTVIDVGANRGYFTVFASQEVGQGKVFSFEPSPFNYEILTDNIFLNSITNVRPEQLAVSSSAKSVDFYLAKGDEAGNSIYLNEGKKIVVKTIDLSTYAKANRISHIDFLKMDCEGEEYEIFNNLPDTFWKMVDKISMEYHEIGSYNPKDLVKILEKNGFKILKFDEKYIMAQKS